MRLLNTDTLELVEFSDAEIPEYAILSHRWQREEVTFKDMHNGSHQSREGYAKIKSCCELAQQRGMAYAWIDTCCIDKSSSAELTESINSMYQWYAKAHECYAYISDVDIQDLDTPESQDQFAASAWFTRGWTLQELIAPSEVLFYNKRWARFGHKTELQTLLSKITSVDASVLAGSLPPSSCSVAQRMSWASKRNTTRAEDIAYCLLGIFEVNMPLLYGEGSRAFFRLQRKIIKQYDDQTIFAWTDNQEQKPVFAPSPACFSNLQSLVCVYPTNDTREGYTLANSGLSIQVMLIPSGMNTFLVPLSCGYPDGVDRKSRRRSIRGYERACIWLRQTKNANHFVRVSHNDRDLEVKNADDIASTRDKLELKACRVFIQQQISNLVEPLFHGFDFSFNYEGFFENSKVPSDRDIVCSNVWSKDRPVLEVLSGTHRAAGIFRLSGLSSERTTIFLHLGFDFDFAPVCVISSVAAFGRDTRKIRDVDFSMVSKHSLDHLLDLKWLLKQVDLEQQQPRPTSETAILAFRGEHQSSAEIVCQRLSLKLLFGIQFSETLKAHVWHVTFERMKDEERSRYVDLDRDVRVRMSPGISITYTETGRNMHRAVQPEVVKYTPRANRDPASTSDDTFRDAIVELSLEQERTRGRANAGANTRRDLSGSESSDSQYGRRRSRDRSRDRRRRRRGSVEDRSTDGTGLDAAFSNHLPRRKYLSPKRGTKMVYPIVRDGQLVSEVKKQISTTDSIPLSSDGSDTKEKEKERLENARQKEKEKEEEEKEIDQGHNNPNPLQTTVCDESDEEHNT